MHVPWALTQGKIRMWSKVFFLCLMLILRFLLYNYYVFLYKCPLIYEYNCEYVVSNSFRNSLISLNASKWCTLVSIHFQVCHYLFISRSPWILCSAPGNCDLFGTCMSHFRRVNKKPDSGPQPQPGGKQWFSVWVWQSESLWGCVCRNTSQTVTHCEKKITYLWQFGLLITRGFLCPWKVPHVWLWLGVK